MSVAFPSHCGAIAVPSHMVGMVARGDSHFPYLCLNASFFLLLPLLITSFFYFLFFIFSLVAPPFSISSALAFFFHFLLSLNPTSSPDSSLAFNFLHIYIVLQRTITADVSPSQSLARRVSMWEPFFFGSGNSPIIPFKCQIENEKVSVKVNVLAKLRKGWLPTRYSFAV